MVSTVGRSESSGIRLWSKASLLHFGRDPVTAEFLPKAPSGGFVQVTPSPATLRLHSINASWHALGTADDLAAANAPRTPVPDWAHYVDLGEYADDFLLFCNNIAWPLQHGLIDQLEESLQHYDLKTLWQGFLDGSAVYAREIARHALPGETQLLNDNHMWLVAGMFRKMYPSLASSTPIGLFIHTPQAEPVLFEKFLGREIASAIIAGMDAADCVMFQSDADLRRFNMTRREFGHGIEHAEVRATHVELDTEEVEQIAGLRATPVDLITDEELRSLTHQRRQARVGMRMVESVKQQLGHGGKVIVGSMRLDPAKGVLELVQSLGALVAMHPEHLGKLHVILRTPESRKYVSYRNEVNAAIAFANERYRNECRKHGVTPIMDLIRRYRTNSRGAAIGATRLADVAVYPSLADGYNISALEAAIAADAATIVVGETAGVAKTLGTNCLCCDPGNIEELAATLHIALSLSSADRQDRLARMRTQLRHSSKVQWLLARTREVNSAYWRHAAAHTAGAGSRSALSAS